MNPIALRYGILLIANPKLTAEAKYVLMQIHWVFGSNVINEQVKVIALKIGSSDKVVSAARDLLLELGYLISAPRAVKKDSESNAGRPSIAFQISPKTLAELEQLNNEHKIGLIHHRRIDALLHQATDSRFKPMFMRNQKGLIPKRQSGVFTPANRILLATLFLLADECGVVSGSGNSKLARLVGMTLVRLESQLNKLAQMGYLLAKEAGVSGRVLFGRSSGALFLNVFNDELGDASNQATLILMQTHSIDHYNDSGWGVRIYSEAQNKDSILFDYHDLLTVNQFFSDVQKVQHMRVSLAEIKVSFSKQKVFDQVCPQIEGKPMILTYPVGIDTFSWTRAFDRFKLQELFKDTPLPTFALYLQLKINEYASMLLTQHWDDLHFNAIPIHMKLVETIKEEIYPTLKRDKLEDSFGTPFIAEALGIFIYRVAYETALQAKCMVENALEGHHEILASLSNASYALLPVTYYEKRVADKFSVAVKLADRSLHERYIQIDADKINHTLTKQTYTATSTSTDTNALLQQFGYYTKISPQAKQHASLKASTLH